MFTLGAIQFVTMDGTTRMQQWFAGDKFHSFFAKEQLYYLLLTRNNVWQSRIVLDHPQSHFYIMPQPSWLG